MREYSDKVWLQAAVVPLVWLILFVIQTAFTICFYDFRFNSMNAVLVEAFNVSEVVSVPYLRLVHFVNITIKYVE